MTESHPLFDPLAALTALHAPVGFEEPVLGHVQKRLASSCERVEIDVRGNVYARQPGHQSDAPVIMITAHADEIGFMVTSVRPDGFLRFTSLGFPTEMVLPGQRVHVLTRVGVIDGVIGVQPGHILHGDASRIVPSEPERYIDIGAKSAPEVAEWGVCPGTPAVFHGLLTETKNPNRVFGKAIDNRAGILVLLEVAHRLAQIQVPASCVYTITVEEEVGLRGAEVAAKHVDPDVIFAVDTVPSGGTPDVSPERLPWTIGAGPLVKVRETRGLSTHRLLRELVVETAQARNIPHQVIVDTAGITDGTSAQQVSGKAAAMVLGLARRYSHSAVEFCDLDDISSLITLLCNVIVSLTSRDQLRRL